MRGLMMRGLICSVMISVSACSPPREHPSVSAFKSLSWSLMSGDAMGAWGGLSVESRRSLSEGLSLTLTAEQLSASEPPTELMRRLTLEPDWRFEHSWGEEVRLSEEHAQAVTLTVRLHEATWHVRGRLVSASPTPQWRFDLLNATREP